MNNTMRTVSITVGEIIEVAPVYGERLWINSRGEVFHNPEEARASEGFRFSPYEHCDGLGGILI